jgi:Ca-activated chloride channel family protein
VLKSANTLFEQGKVDETRRSRAAREQTLRSEAVKAKNAAPAPRAREVDEDFDRQIAAVDGATSGFATPPRRPPRSPTGPRRPRPPRPPPRRRPARARAR